MRTYGTVTTAMQAYAKDMPSAGSVKSYCLEEEFETKIARNLQRIIKIGKPGMKAEYDARREAIQGIILDCVRELEENEHPTKSF